MSLPAAAAMREPDVPALIASAAPALSFRKALRSTIVLPIVSADNWAGFVIVFERRGGDARFAPRFSVLLAKVSELSCRCDRCEQRTLRRPHLHRASGASRR